MALLLIDEAIVLDHPPLSFAWTSHLGDALASLGRSPTEQGSKSGGHCVVKATTFLGLPFETTLYFDATDRLVRARFDPPRDPPDPLDPEPEGIIPEPLEMQVARHAASIQRRRAALEASLGPGEVSASPGHHLVLPCKEMRWRHRRTVVTHDVLFSVERGGDAHGWLINHVEVTHEV